LLIEIHYLLLRLELGKHGFYSLSDIFSKGSLISFVMYWLLADLVWCNMALWNTKRKALG